MVLIVTRTNGQREEITLPDGAVVSGAKIVTPDGAEHWFFDGYYDGWGMALDGHQVTPQEGEQIAAAFESQRKVLN